MAGVRGLRFNVFLDFDGTLIDTGPGVKECIRETLMHFGYPCLEESILNKFLGPPLEDSFSLYCSMKKNEVHDAVKFFRKIYNDDGLWNAKVYPYVVDGLKLLIQSGIRIYIVSSKPKEFIVKLLDREDIKDMFSGIEANSISGIPREKDKLIELIMEREKMNCNNCFMVGDRKYDVQAARAIGIGAVGVTYGYGSKDELETAGADYIANSFVQAASWLIKWCEENARINKMQV